jgi:hypothetical protein
MLRWGLLAWSLCAMDGWCNMFTLTAGCQDSRGSCIGRNTTT